MGPLLRFPAHLMSTMNITKLMINTQLHKQRKQSRYHDRGIFRDMRKSKTMMKLMEPNRYILYSQKLIRQHRDYEQMMMRCGIETRYKRDTY